ncbi:MAG TPA: helix-turn-helix domain-containing protein [Clostridiales bacterium]|nr:helix-turn-helix domain-containing protein [Clostridiales bacterium]HQD31684.1 helix-turn-helix domain-containing protein [Clostridiales bacterium]
MEVRLFQNLINQIRECVDGNFGIMDDTGLILGCTDEQLTGTTHPLIDEVIDDNRTDIGIRGWLFRKIYIRNRLEFIVYTDVAEEQGKALLTMFAINVSNLKTYHEDKFDKGNFFKNVITDNILPGDIQIKAKELHIPFNVPRLVFLIKTDKVKDVHPHEVVLGLFPKKQKDFVIALDEETLVLIKELKDADDFGEVDRTAKAIIDTLNTELMVKAHIGIGTIAENIREIGRSFKEAQTALQIGSIFDSDKSILNYNNLGIGRLIYQLPTTMCRLFLKEVFKKGSLESLDQETLLTIQKFFENNLNVSETSRQLYVHRNTLVYRLDKIQKTTGLDLRKFDDAIIFKVSLLVKKYLDKAENVQG